MFASLAGITLQVTDFAEEEALVIGDETRSDGGTLRGIIVTEKRKFSGRLNEMDLSTYNTLRAAVDLGAQVAFTGDVIAGVTLTVRAFLSKVDYVHVAAGFLVNVSFRLEQV